MDKYILVVLVILGCFSCKDKIETNALSKPNASRPTDIASLYQYYHADPASQEQMEENQIIEYAADHNLEAIRTRSGVYIASHIVGSGDSVSWGDRIKVHYKGYFLNGEEFDSSFKRGKPLEFRVGTMVAGWNEALPFLNRGSKATLLIPSHMGYGKEGFKGFVGPNKILLFDVDIMAD
jgi:FKBP-type peptidyl-prolyl cis-trans isomerase